MPTLLEVQRAVCASLVDRDDGAAAAMLADEPDRLDIYRNTFVIGVTKALRLSYPAVHLLVGETFFDGAAALFIAQCPPRAAYLDEYGAEFPEFLRDFQPAASLVYLPDVARLEWAVSRAIHAADVPPMDLTQLSALSPAEQSHVALVPHPSVAVLRTATPADVIWRAVLSRDDDALAAVDVDAGPAHLIIERLGTGVEVLRLDAAEWHFAAALCDGRPIEAALADAPEGRAEVLLAGHLAAGRLVDFHLAPAQYAAPAATTMAALNEVAP
jgi:Putative DNA-binding domain